MAFEQNKESITLLAAADHSANQYRFMTVDSAGKAALAGVGVKAEGVLQNTPKTDEAGEVLVAGISKIVAGAAVSIGANVASDASGRAVTAVAGNFILGTALQASTAAGQIISVHFEIAGKL